MIKLVPQCYRPSLLPQRLLKINHITAVFFKNTFVVSHKAKPENIFVFPDYRRQSRPPQSPNYNNTSASRGGNDVDSMIKSSKLSANAPEFVPLGFNQYDVREQFYTTH